MTNNFDLKKYLIENKATQTSILREGMNGPWNRNNNIGDDITNLNNDEDSLLIKANEFVAINGDTTPEELAKELNISIEEAIKLIDELTVNENTSKNSSKMKKSQFKSKIKEMILMELNNENPDEDYEKLNREVEANINPYSSSDNIEDIDEAKKKDEDEDIDFDEETPKGDEDIDITSDPKDGEAEFNIDTSAVDPNIKAVQDALTQAQAAAEKLADEKLTKQIGNTITMFTRTHIAQKEQPQETNI